jgi:hypothetical protein
MREGRVATLSGDASSSLLDLGTVIRILPELDDGLTIYIAGEEPWGERSPVLLAFPDAAGDSPIEAAGFTYLLEVALAKEALHVLREDCDGQDPRESEQTAAVLHYAEHDTFLPKK